MTDRKPDLIIGIDFGMTCTGVAYAVPSSGVETVRHIQKWPGRMQANEDKVPTIVVYPKNQLVPSHWGFTADTVAIQTASNMDHCEWFKTFIDESELQRAQTRGQENSGVPRSFEELERWYTDYFRLLNQHIETKLQPDLGRRWDDLKIEFLFSVPTTWKPNPTVERFRTIVQRAGFGRATNHTVSIGLTEAEAAAVHTVRESPASFNENDLILICDVGGGTTDLSALRVSGTAGNGSVSLRQVDTVLGKNIGSTRIDMKFEELVTARLQQAEASMPMGIDIGGAAWEMMKGREYQNAKCEYGSSDDTESFSVTVPKLHKAYRNDAVGIINGDMMFRRDDLKALFDSQVTLLYELIDRQLQRIQEKAPGEQVRHLVLSGGLGNSQYVRLQLSNRYGWGASRIPNATDLQVRVAPDTTLVVCKGLVADRLVKTRSGKSILGWRCCRASYGTRCRVKYDPKNTAHFGLTTIQDSLDGQLYIENVVDWFIKQGEPVSIDFPIERKFQQRIPPGDPRRIFPTHVVSSEVDKEYLPFIVNDNCKILCQVLSDFSTVDITTFKLKNRHFWNTGKKYYRVEYVVKVGLGPADIWFELWFRGKKYSLDNLIRVEWQEAEQPKILPTHNQLPQPEYSPQNGRMTTGY